MTYQPIIDCPKCGTRVIPTSDGVCPACRVQLPAELVPVVASPRVDHVGHADEQQPDPAVVKPPKTIEPASSKPAFIDRSLKGNLKWVGQTFITLCIAIPIILVIELVFPGAGRGRIGRAIDQAAKLKQANEQRQPVGVGKEPSFTDRERFKFERSLPKGKVPNESLLKVKVPTLVPPSAEESTTPGPTKQPEKLP